MKWTGLFDKINHNLRHNDDDNKKPFWCQVSDSIVIGHNIASGVLQDEGSVTNSQFFVVADFLKGLKSHVCLCPKTEK